jgi:RecA/RadA recombinase
MAKQQNTKASGNSLLDKLKKNSTLDNIAVLAESKLVNNRDFFVTEVPMINVALSGDIDGGMQPGLLQIAGESKHFKSSFLLLMVKSFQDKHPEGVTIFYVSEFGTPMSYFESLGIDTTRVLFCPVTDIEMLKADIAKQLQEIKDGDNVMIAVDSLGNLASRKEVEDAIEGKFVADMTRAKQLKSFFRIVTPHLTIKSLYMVVINHVYQEIGMFPKTIVGGGKGSYLASDNIWIIGREQEKEGKDVIGYTFNIRVEKSRFVKEKSVFPIRITFDGGIEKFSGLLELAEEMGILKLESQRPKTWVKVNFETGAYGATEYSEDDMDNDEFWVEILKDETFKEHVRTTYKVAYSSLLGKYEKKAVTENE